MPLGILGLLAGMGQGMEQSKQKELEQKKLQMGLDLLEQQTKDLTRKNKLIEELLGIGKQAEAPPQDVQPTTPGPFRVDPALRLPSTPPQMGGGQNKISMIVNKAMENDPQAIAQVEALKIAGVDLGPAIGIAQKNREFGLNEKKFQASNLEVITETDRQTGEEFQYFKNKVSGEKVGQPWLRKQADIDKVEITNKDGSKSTLFVRKTPQGLMPVQLGQQAPASPEQGGGLPASPPAAPGGPGIQTAPGPMDMPVMGAEVQNWKNAEGKIPPPGMTPNQLRAQGYEIAEKEKTPDVAGKIATTEAALKSYDEYKKLIIDPKTGKVNQRNVLTMNAPGGGFPKSEGRRAYNLFIEGLDAKIRAMTGAAITKEEVPFYERMFMPSPFDDDQTAMSKVQRYEGFLKSYLRELKPSEKMKPGEYTVQAGGKTMVVTPDKAGKAMEPGEERGSDLLNQQRYKTPDAVREAYRAGKLDREQAKKLLKGMGYE